MGDEFDDTPSQLACVRLDQDKLTGVNDKEPSGA